MSHHCPTRLITALIAITLISSMHALGAPEQSSMAEALQQLKTAIANTEATDRDKEREIDILKQERAMATTDADRYVANRRLHKIYSAYICDSALYYINENIAIARRLGDDDKLRESILSKGGVLAKAGLYREALELQESVDPSLLNNEQKGEYYHNYFDTYQYMSEYALGTEYEKPYSELITRYADSTLMVSDPQSFFYRSLYPTKLFGEGRLDEAESYISELLDHYQPGTREYSIMASLLAFCYFHKGDTPKQAYYLALSAASDVTGSVKENMSLRALAELLFLKGEVNDANLLLKKSMDDAVFYASRLRNNQSANLLPLIDRAYDDARNAYSRELKLYIWLVGILAVILILMIIAIIREMHKVARSNRELSLAGEEMKALNDELRAANDKAAEANSQLTEANNIKEVSIRSYMELSATSINTLERYRTSLYHKMKTGKRDELEKIISSTQIINDSVKEFYTTFDNAFLSIFPSFVEQFNHFFPADARFAEREGRLNTELRIYALIRMGITDSQKIADFLRCSLSTVYTYRSRVKNRSLHPDDLDEMVAKIG